MTILVKDPGLATTVQDRGCWGHSHLGVSPAGAADSLSFRIANLLVGNDENAPALEMTLIGATLQFAESKIIAVAGSTCIFQVNGREAACGQAIEVDAGSVVQIGRMTTGVRAYLAVQGGLDVPLIMGSASTQLGARFGGFEGRLLRKGDRLRVCDSTGSPPRAIRSGVLTHAQVALPASLRVTRGSQQDWFDAEAFAVLFSSSFSVTDQAGRSGLRLRGQPILPRNASQLLTDGVPLGAIQIPPDGQPIILFVDQQTTGGYPKIANVIAADMHVVGQLRARDTVRFTEVSIEHAIALLQQQELWLKQIFTN